MSFAFETLDCNIFGDFKVGDNSVYNANILCDLCRANDGGRFNKLIVLQIASLLEAAFAQIFYRAKHYSREGVPNISDEDRKKIAKKQIDKFTVIIANLKKYEILAGLGDGIYDELDRLRKYRNKVHIQIDVGIDNVPRDEATLFTGTLVGWALDLNWKTLKHLGENFRRPKEIGCYVGPLQLPVRE